jgi:hypothetical protein
VNGSVGVNKGQALNNKVLTLYDFNGGESLATATGFFGFGVNTGAMRYQTPTTNTTHVWYNGTTYAMSLTSTNLTVAGDITASNRLIALGPISSSSTGTIGITYSLTNGQFLDFTDTIKTLGFNEPGNPGKAGSMFHQGFFSGSNCSQENINWSRARLIIRGCTLNTNDVPTNVNLNIRCYNSNAGSNVTLTTMTCKDYGSLQGYTTNISPFFSLSNIVNPYLGLQLATSNVTYRVGNASIIFSA